MSTGATFIFRAPPLVITTESPRDCLQSGAASVPTISPHALNLTSTYSLITNSCSILCWAYSSSTTILARARFSTTTLSLSSSKNTSKLWESLAAFYVFQEKKVDPYLDSSVSRFCHWEESEKAYCSTSLTHARY